VSHSLTWINTYGSARPESSREIAPDGFTATLILTAREGAPEMSIPIAAPNNAMTGWHHVLAVGPESGSWKVIHGKPLLQQVTLSPDPTNLQISQSSTGSFRACLGYLLTGVKEDNEKVLYTRQDMGDRWVFHRSAITFNRETENARLFTTEHIRKDSNYQFAVLLLNEDVGDGPEVGDIYYSVWQIMKNDRHVIPRFRTQDISPWSTGHDVQTIGFQVLWNKQDGTWRQRYLQKSSEFHRLDEDVQMSDIRWSSGSALYAYFTRSTYLHARSWLPTLGFADQIVVDIDGFRWEVTLRNETGPVRKLGSLAWSEQVATNRMHNLHIKTGNTADNSDVVKIFDNVAGPRGSLTVGRWVDVHPEMSTTTKKFVKSRSECDRCFLLLHSRLGEVECERYEDTNRRLRCVQQGLHVT